MKRQTKLFLSLANRLDKEIDISIELFLQKRSFLITKEEVMSMDLEEIERENEVRMNTLIRKIVKI